MRAARGGVSRWQAMQTCQSNPIFRFECWNLEQNQICSDGSTLLRTRTSSIPSYLPGKACLIYRACSGQSFGIAWVCLGYLGLSWVRDGWGAGVQHAHVLDCFGASRKVAILELQQDLQDS